MTSYFFFSVILSNLLLLIAFSYGIFNKELRVQKQIKLLLYYFGFVLFIELTNEILINIFEIRNTQSIYPFYIAGEFFILIQLLLYDLKAERKWHIVAVVVAVYILTEGLVLWIINNDASTGYGKVISHLVIVCLSAYILLRKLKQTEIKSEFPIIYAALFLYYSVALFLFLLMNQLTKTTINIWILHNLLSSIFYGSTLYTFYRLKKC